MPKRRCEAAIATLAQAQANLDHQKADTTRTVALAKQGIASEQANDEAIDQPAGGAGGGLDRAARMWPRRRRRLKQARGARTADCRFRAHRSVNARPGAECQGTRRAGQVELGYAQVFAPVSGIVNVLAARQGEVLAAGGTIATVMDLTQTWVYAPLPETQADAVQLGDSLRVVMPSGATVQGKVIAKSALADFATQRDINGGRKRDIRTVQIKLLIPNPEERFVPGMTADVYMPEEQAGEAMMAAETLRRRTPSSRAIRGARAIAVENIVKRYGDFEAVKGVNFSGGRGRNLRPARS